MSEEPNKEHVKLHPDLYEQVEQLSKKQQENTVHLTDGNGRTIKLYTSPIKEKAPTNWVSVLSVFLVIIAQVVGITIFITINAENAKKVPGLEQSINDFSPRLATVESHLKALEGVMNNLQNLTDTVNTLKGFTQQYPVLANDVAAMLQVTAHHAEVFLEVEKQIERVTAEQDTLRSIINNISDRHFYESDWLVEKETLREQRASDMRYFEVRLSQLVKDLNAIQKQVEQLQSQ